MKSLLKRFGVAWAATVAFLGLLIATSPVSQAQGGITVSFPARVAAAPDFATEVLGDPWDMCNAQDVSPDPDQLVGFTSFNFLTGPCRAGGTTGPVVVNGAPAVDSNLAMLAQGLYGQAVNPGRNGRNFPIDTAKYQVLSFKVSSSTTEDPQVYWFHHPSAHPAGLGLGGRVAPRINPGTQVVVADLTQSLIPGMSPWTDGVVRGLRLDPNAFNAVQTVFFYWVRLTPSANSPLAAKQTISWTGSGPATITVRDSGGSVYPIVSNLAANSYLWNYGVLAPGSYTLTVTNSSGSGSRVFSINQPPSIEVTDPSPTTGQDFATTVLGNAWDMSSAADIQITGTDNFNNISFGGGQLHATNTNDDPNVTLLFYTNNSVPIDTSRFRYLTYRLQVDGAYDLGLGSVARVFWTAQPTMSGFTAAATLPIIVWPGMNSYTIDLASLSTASDGGLEPLNVAEPWTAGPKRHFRFDPHEFGQARTFHIDDIKLTAKPMGASTFVIRFLGADGDGDAATVSLYYDTDTNAANGKTLIVSGVPQATGQYVWNTTAVALGDYYIYAESSDGIQTIGRYSTVPVQLSRVPSTPGGFRIVP
jgi:hypothetical protein